jgi:hypothetical protein
VGVLKSCAFWKIMFHILMLQQNSIKTRKNFHVNIAIACRENDQAKQRVESTEPSETPQEQNNRLHREQQTVQQATARAQLFLGNDTLQLFGNEDVSAPTRWDCGEMDTIYGFYNVKMWIKDWLAKSNNNNP